MRRITAVLVLAGLVSILVGCGGGADDNSADGSLASTLMQRRHALSGADPMVATASQVTQLMELGESQFAVYFPSKQPTRFAGTLAYRFYPETGAYLIVDGDQVLVAGPPFGGPIVYVGLVTDFIRPPVPTFPLRDAYQAFVAAGTSNNFNVSGGCSGTASVVASPTSPTTFEGAQAFVSTQTTSIKLTNCTPATNAVSSLGYYDVDYTPIGSVIPGVEYATFLTKPPSLPTTVKVGDTAIFATLTVYSSATKTTITGQRVLSYVVDGETATTAIVRLVVKPYNAANQLQFTQQSSYRITQDGTLSILIMDVQYGPPSNLHLVYTKV